MDKTNKPSHSGLSSFFVPIPRIDPSGADILGCQQVPPYQGEKKVAFCNCLDKEELLIYTMNVSFNVNTRSFNAYFQSATRKFRHHLKFFPMITSKLHQNLPQIEILRVCSQIEIYAVTHA